MLLLVAAAIVGLVVLGALGPGGERPTRPTGPSPPEARAGAPDLECRLYVSFGMSTAGSVTVGAPAAAIEGPETRIYVTVSDGPDSVVGYRVSDPTGCASSTPPAAVPRVRT